MFTPRYLSMVPIGALLALMLGCGGDQGGDGDGADDAAVSDASTTDTSSKDTGDATDAAQDVGLECPGGPGCPCDGNDDCDAALCLEGADGKRCGKPCVDTCDAGFVCAQVPQGSDVVTVCVDAWARLCSPCSKSQQCWHPGVNDARCVDLGAAGAFCGAACDTDDDCPKSHACNDVKDVAGGDTKQCVPVDAAGDPAACVCSKNALSLALKTPCSKTAVVDGGEITCGGKALCKEVGQGAVCLASDPAAETCDGLDNDCDGATDEASCDDDNPCTTDSCAPAKGCDNAPVKDGAACGADDKTWCQAGACVAKPDKT